MYGFPPPQIAEMFLPDATTETAAEMLSNREAATAIIKENLKQAQEKVQPYSHCSLDIHRSIKLHSKFYGPFRVLLKVGNAAYKLLLPEGCNLHHTFHVSQLKKHHGPVAIPTPTLPLVDAEGNIQTGPEAILDRKLTPRKQGAVSAPIVQWKVKWTNLPEEAATWEDSTFIQKVFPSFQP